MIIPLSFNNALASSAFIFSCTRPISLKNTTDKKMAIFVLYFACQSFLICCYQLSLKFKVHIFAKGEDDLRSVSH